MSKWSYLFAGSRGSLTLAAVSLAYVALVIAICPIRFTDNDCVLIRDYAINGLHVQFSGLLFSDLLHELYRILPSVPWYGAILYTCHVLCIFIWLKLIFRLFKDPWLAGLFAGIFLAYYLIFLISLDYTSTGAMLCATGLTLASLSVMAGDKGYRAYIFFGLLFMLGTWVRPQVALGALAFFLPLALYAAWCAYAASPSRDRLKWIMLAALLFLAPGALNTAYDYFYRAELQPAAEKQFYDFNAVRGHLVRLNSSRKRALIHDHKLLKSIHWRVADIRGFYGWDFLDERVYNAKTLGTLLSHADPKPVDLRSVLRGTFVTPFLRIEAPFLLLLGSAVLFLLIPGRPIALRILGGATPFYCMLVIALMKTQYVFPERVSYPFAMGLGFSALLIAAMDFHRAGQSAAPARGSIPLLISTAICLAGALLYLVNMPHMDFRKRRSDLPVIQKIDALNNQQVETTLIQPHHGLQLERLNPLKEPSIKSRQIRLGWNTFSPGFYQQLSTLGVSQGYEMMDAMVGNPRAFLLGRPDWCRTQVAHASDPANIRIVAVQHFQDGTILCRLER